MIKHKKIYLEAFGYDINDHSQFVPSEISEQKSVDIHHIIGRGKGGEDRVENLMALTRQEHHDYGDKKEYIVYLFKIHKRRMEIMGVSFNEEWIDKQIEKYEHYNL
jgi:hypothetical protein